MNLPNKITVVRIVLIPFIVFFYLSTSFIACGKLIAAGLFAVACLTDFLDGYLARKLNLVTTLGKFLDSIADKMLVLGAFALVVADNTILAPYGVIAFVIVIFRELIISALRQMAASKNVVIAADMWGKVKANFQFFAISGGIILPNVSPSRISSFLPKWKKKNSPTSLLYPSWNSSSPLKYGNTGFNLSSIAHTKAES